MESHAEELFETIVSEGTNAIDALIEASASEELYLDFKRSADNGRGSKLHNVDRRNFGRAISGFGNSEGGVIIWGVECSKTNDGRDVAAEKFELADAAKFKSLLENAVGALTTPLHKSVRSQVILTEHGKGFVATLIPQSNDAPLQTVDDKQYRMRAGSTFMPIPHGVLAGMFGRRPQPKIIHQWLINTPVIEGRKRVAIKFELFLRNEGAGIAEHPYVTFWSWSKPGDACDIIIDPDKTPEMWMNQFSLGRHFTIIARDGVRIPPGGIIFPVSLAISLSPPFDAPLHIEGKCGAASCEPIQFEISLPPEIFSEGFDRYLAHVDSGETAELAVTQLTDSITSNWDAE